MDENEKKIRIRVLLSLQRALVGSVTKNMLAVYVSWTETDVHVRFFFENAVSPFESELVSIIETEMTADIPTHKINSSMESSCNIDELPKPFANEVIVFGRAKDENFTEQ